MTLPPASLTDYAPGGRLRVAINHGNVILAGRDAEGPKGISVDLARALAAELGVEPDFVEYDRAVDVASRADKDAWDVCFLAVDPARAQAIAFTQPYIRIEGCYLVGPGSPAQTAEDVVRLGLRIGAVEGSAYALHLGRAPGAENLVLMPAFAAACRAFDSGAIDGLAGIRRAMQGVASSRPGARLLEPPFMEIRQAMGLPAARPAAHAHLSAFLAERARNGSLARILEAHGVDGACALMPGQ